MTDDVVLRVRDLHVSIPTRDGAVQAVRGVDLDLRRARTLAVVGESGCGKSMMVRALVGLTPAPEVKLLGAVEYGGRDLLRLPESALASVRGREIGLVLQDAMNSLNPVLRVGAQLVETLRAHDSMSRAQARRRAVELLGEVGIAEPARRVDAYPHELSGGMRQRVLIAIALACDPAVILADEPTTALDVTVQAQILDLLMRIRADREAALLLVTHDLGVVGEVADDVAVMYAGEIVECGVESAVLGRPRHPYTGGLLESTPRIDGRTSRHMTTIAGAPPRLNEEIVGCGFRERCPLAFSACEVRPALEARGATPDHLDRCWLGERIEEPAQLTGSPR